MIMNNFGVVNLANGLTESLSDEECVWQKKANQTRIRWIGSDGSVGLIGETLLFASLELVWNIQRNIQGNIQVGNSNFRLPFVSTSQGASASRQQNNRKCYGSTCCRKQL